jgi:hypothetical protein
LWEWLPATIIAARCRSHRKHTSSSEAGYGARRHPLDSEIDRLHPLFFPL